LLAVLSFLPATYFRHFLHLMLVVGALLSLTFSAEAAPVSDTTVLPAQARRPASYLQLLLNQHEALCSDAAAARGPAVQTAPIGRAGAPYVLSERPAAAWVAGPVLTAKQAGFWVAGSRVRLLRATLSPNAP
jgi:hypothetical protein